MYYNSFSFAVLQNSLEVNNLLGPGSTCVDPPAIIEGSNGGPKGEHQFPSIVQQTQEAVTTTSTTTPSTGTGTLSDLGIEPGVCLKNVAAIINTQQQQKHHVITSGSPGASHPGTKELPAEAIEETKQPGKEQQQLGQKPDFHFDKHSSFSGGYNNVLITD